MKLSQSDYIYAISRGYSKITIWTCVPGTRQRMSVLTFTPFKQLSRLAKYNSLMANLFNLGIPQPDYKPLKQKT